MEYAVLKKSWLSGAKLQGVYLPLANLQGAYLYAAKLQGADLAGADLRGAVLADASLLGANFWKDQSRPPGLEHTNFQLPGLDKDAVFDETTVLPDAVVSEYRDGIHSYTPDSFYKPGVTDMRRYTDPSHPDFWQPEWMKVQQQERTVSQYA
jgi:hypothetical protein